MSNKTFQADHHILFLPHHVSSFGEMLPIAIQMQDQGQFEPEFIISWRDNGAAIDICHEHGLKYCFSTSATRGASEKIRSNEGNSAGDSKDSVLRRLTRCVRSSRLLRSRVEPLLRRFTCGELVDQIVRLYSLKRRARSLLRKIQPACILLVGDRHVGLETAMVRLANNEGIPSLIVPIALSDPAGAVALRQRSSNWKNIYGMSKEMNRLVVRFKPQWAYTANGVTLLWHSAGRMLAAALWGIMPENPWTLGGGRAWYMAVESEQVRESFEQQGVPSEKLIVTGKPRYDKSANVWRNQVAARCRICGDLGLNPQDPLLVCAVPQLAEHHLLSWVEHWKEIEFLFSGLARAHPEVNVVLSLHPKSDAAQYVVLADKYGLIISCEQGFEQLVPVCDAFVATYSSTVTLAIACHKPAIVVDFYGLNYDLFDEVPGIVVLRDKSELVSTLQRLFTDQNYYNSLVDGQAKVAGTWAWLDGYATQRIIDLIMDIVAQGQAIQQLPPRQRHQALPAWSQRRWRR